MSSRDMCRVGIAGLGRSGWNIHFRHLSSLGEQYQIVAVMDPSAERRQEAAAAIGCRTYERFGDLVDDHESDVVVVASPNTCHAEHTLAALAAGKHVVCEKPFALSIADADRMIDAARRAGRIVAPFYNRRYEPHLLKVKQVLASGVLGQIVQIRLAWHLFTRRWDWQTLKEFGGGALSNNGSHLIDHALQLFGEDVEPEVFADLKRTPLTAGDADDHMKVVLYAPGCPTVDIELTNAAAYPQDRWHIMGSSGGLRGTTEKLEWKWVDLSKAPARAVSREAAEGRLYQQETYAWQEATWVRPIDSKPEPVLFYLDLHESLRRGAPLTITPQSVRRQIAVVEKCRRICLV